MVISDLFFHVSHALAQGVPPIAATTPDAQISSDVSQLWDLVIDFYYRLIIPGASILAGIVIFYAGILYATSNGNDETIKNAKTYITGALSGLALVLFASFIIQFVGGN